MTPFMLRGEGREADPRSPHRVAGVFSDRQARRGTRTRRAAGYRKPMASDEILNMAGAWLANPEASAGMAVGIAGRADG